MRRERSLRRLNLFDVEMSDESQPHLQRGPESSYNALHVSLHHVADEHVFNMIPIVERVKEKA